MKLKEAYLVSDFCIGATEAVASVSLFSEVPMEHIEKVLLDYQSRTSINLAKVLLKHYWKKDVEFVSAYENMVIPEHHIAALGQQIEAQRNQYEETWDEIEVAVALVKADGFDRAEVDGQQIGRHAKHRLGIGCRAGARTAQ